MNATRADSKHPLARRAVKWIGYAALTGFGILATIVVVYAWQARARLPDLRAWHQVQLQSEYRAGQAGMPVTFAEYLALEERLFKEVRTRVVDDARAADTWPLSRYTPQGVVSKLALESPYNHSFELAPAGEPRGSALLVHGLSDSPYSMRALAETFVAQGYYVVALRMPGHGTVPSGLLDVQWEDWYGAAVLAANHAVAHGGKGKPFVAAGHSTGAALVTLYSLRSLNDPALTKPTDLFLVSAAIGISPFASLTDYLASLSFIPGLEKSKWMDVLPEYDPYKYNSFPVNAANQIYKLTQAVQDSIDASAPEALAAMPRVHMYQSIVDATVTSREVVQGLLARLPPKGHELVVFDINRRAAIEAMIAPGPLEDLERMRAAKDLPFRLTLISNRDRDTPSVSAYTREAETGEVKVTELAMEWPIGVFSVGHVSLPFPADDPVYGLTRASASFNLGAIGAKGESGALVVGLGTFARLRSNPFFDVIRESVMATLNAPAP